MSTITLDSIREAVEKKYAPTVVELGEGRSMTLVPVLRLPKEVRKQIAELSDRKDEDRDLDEAMIGMLRLVATDPADVDHFLDVVNHDLAVVSEVFNTYSKGSELGEASPSES